MYASLRILSAAVLIALVAFSPEKIVFKSIAWSITIAHYIVAIPYSWPKIQSLAADKISAGTMTAVNVSAGTYSLVSGDQQMLVNTTDGFIQKDTGVQNRQARIFGGELTIGLESNGAVQATYSHDQIELQNFNGNRGVLLQNNSSNEGVFRLYNANSIRVGADVTNNQGRFFLRNASGVDEITIQARGASSSGDSIVIDNSSGTTRVEIGIAPLSAGANGRLVCLGGTTCEVRSGSSTTTGLYVGAQRVVGPRQADPGASPTTDQLRTVLLNHGLI